ncbi:MAG: hypothetical protein K6C11_00355 [Bacilli bacterium]|nr:hypothetical protein [Bacilli bacterium]
MKINDEFNYDYLRSERAKIENMIDSLKKQEIESKDSEDRFRIINELKIYREQIACLNATIPDQKSTYGTYLNESLYSTLFNDSYMNLEEEKTMIYDNQQFIPLIAKFGEKSTTYFEDYELSKLYRAKKHIIKSANRIVSYDDILSINHDFYNSLEDKEIVDAFNTIFNNRDNNLRFNGNRSYTKYFVDTNHRIQSLISLEAEEEDMNIMGTAHEYGHAIENWLKDWKKQKQDDVFTELISQFFQTLICKYLIDNNIYKTRAINYDILYYHFIVSNCASVLVFDSAKDMEFKERKEFYDYVKGSYDQHLYENIKGNTFSDCFKYSFPYSVVIELMDTYDKDPEYALYLLKEVAKDSKSDRYNFLKEHNIEVGTHVEDYVRKIRQNIKNIK